ncbi:hypothetical protein AAJ72_08880 [Citromicrobium sp. RCC1885]|uniref:hypothetical protein n=1 Tax=unclassified Citromicrobium TaxID=2630544 RepID=UPI0006C8F980|nr:MULTISPECIES: hypothetical protein [unclassified Citromicrobium]KPM23027.1 hypothetical protein AAJ72_08880 [Citromicrobium sp. RCC1885]KPM27169.1 hypothetical protein AAJ74_09620 [Citromicrobium sp. RCC1878]OAM09060.1 hypothetical protein A0U43_10680 [Citromicrobium sp. RCC1897]
MSEPADLEAGLRAYLLDYAPLSAIGGRVFAGELPADETAAMPRGAIVLKSSGGVSLTAESENDHDTQRIDLFTFGATPREAGVLMRIAARGLRRLKRGIYGGVLIHWVNPAGGSAQGREPGTEWPRHFQSFQALHGLTQVQP